MKMKDSTMKRLVLLLPTLALGLCGGVVEAFAPFAVQVKGPQMMDAVRNLMQSCSKLCSSIGRSFPKKRRLIFSGEQKQSLMNEKRTFHFFVVFGMLPTFSSGDILASVIY